MGQVFLRVTGVSILGLLMSMVALPARAAGMPYGSLVAEMCVVKVTLTSLNHYDVYTAPLCDTQYKVRTSKVSATKDGASKVWVNGQSLALSAGQKVLVPGLENIEAEVTSLFPAVQHLVLTLRTVQPPPPPPPAPTNCNSYYIANGSYYGVPEADRVEALNGKWEYNGGYTRFQGKEYFDYCDADGLLHEYFCNEQDAVQEEIIQCEATCSWTACKNPNDVSGFASVACTETDAGIDFGTQGKATATFTYKNPAKPPLTMGYTPDRCVQGINAQGQLQPVTQCVGEGCFLEEDYCQDPFLKQVPATLFYACPAGCQNGACVEN